MFVPVNHQVVLCGESLLRQNDFIYFGVKKMVLLKKKRTTQDTINIYIYFFKYVCSNVVLLDKEQNLSVLYTHSLKPGIQ